MKFIVPVLLFSLITYSQSQPEEKVSTVQMIKILNDNTAEAEFYYENNWKELRKTAVKKGYIDSFQLLKVDMKDESPYDLILITTYKNKEQYFLREDHFSEIIELRGPLKLLNEKQPGLFRKSVFVNENVHHLEN